MEQRRAYTISMPNDDCRDASRGGGEKFLQTENTATNVKKGSKGCKRKWKLHEDRALVSCMIELCQEGTYNAPSGFSMGYLPALEKMLRAKLPNTDLKANPHIESRIKTLRNDWSIVYDMIYGSSTSGFGWDFERKLVLADDEVWDTYVKSHPKATPFRTRSLWYFEEFTTIYGKDRALGKDAQGVEDVLEEITGQGNNEDHVSESTHESEGSAVRVDGENTRIDVPLKKRKVTSTSLESSTAESMINTAKMLGNDIKEIGRKISRSIGVELRIQEKAEELYGALKEVGGLSRKEMFAALRKIPNHPTQMSVFFSLPSEEKIRVGERFSQ